jgi:hypothetical protein
MAYSYRQGAKVVFTKDDGQPGAGELRVYKASEGWKVDIQDEGCVEISNYLAKPSVPSVIVPWHRIWEISTI